MRRDTEGSRRSQAIVTIVDGRLPSRMFRPPPTVIEIGTEQDIRQFEEVMRKRTSPSPIKQPAKKPVFDSPDVLPTRTHRTMSTPTASLESPL
jgi:hypothetical protein